MKKATLLLAFALTSITLIAQDYSLKDVGRTSLRNFGEIFNNEIVTGYYFFYASEKVGKGEMAYEIVVLDENLTEVSSERIVDNKRLSLVEAAYNGSHILFKFYDSSARKISYRTLDENGKINEANKVERSMNSYELQVMKANTSSEINSIYTPDENGFIDLHTYKQKAYTYEVSYIDNSGNIKWNYIAEKDKGVLGGIYLTGSSESILLMEMSSKSLFSRDYVFSITSIDLEGNKQYNVPLERSEYNLMPHNAIYNPQTKGYLLVGEYYNASEKMMKAEGVGVFVQEISEDGQMGDANFVSWERDVYKELDGEDLEKASKFSVYFHDVVVTNDGTIIAIGEQYKKQVSAAGVALKALAGGGQSGMAMTEMIIGDMLIIQMGKTGDFEDVHVLNKEKNRVYLPEGYSTINSNLLGKAMKSMGNYDYEFRQFNKDHTVMTIGYYDFVKEKGKLFGKKGYFHFATFVDGEKGLSKEKIELETEATELRVYRSKPGYVMVAEYSSKTRTIKLRLEPVNY